MKSLNPSKLQNSIYLSLIEPQYRKRYLKLIDYILGVEDEEAVNIAINLKDTKDVFYCINPWSVARAPNKRPTLFLQELANHYQAEIRKQLSILVSLKETHNASKLYLARLYNKATCEQDFTYGLPKIINELIPADTPKEFKYADLREDAAYLLLTKLEFTQLLLK
jgi:hypothetical protein